MSHPDFDCPDCRDTGLVPSARWWDDDADHEPCARKGCVATEERAELAQQESGRSGTQCPLRSDLAGTTPSPGGASDDAGVLFASYAALSAHHAVVELADFAGRFVGIYRVDCAPGQDVREAAHAKATEEAEHRGARLVRFEAEAAS